MGKIKGALTKSKRRSPFFGGNSRAAPGAPAFKRTRLQSKRWRSFSHSLPISPGVEEG